MRILERYILKELIRHLFISILVFTFTLIVGNLIKLADLVINKGVAGSYILKILFFLTPSLLVYTIPMSILAASLITMGRLGADNETVAMRSSGISLIRILKPLFIVGGIVSLCCIIINDTITPYSHYMVRKLVKEVGIRNPTSYLEAGQFIKDFKGYILFIFDIDKNKLNNIRIYQPQENRPTRTIVAKAAEFISLPEKGAIKLKLTDGSSDEVDPKDPTRFYKLNFKSYYVTLDLKDNINNQVMEKKLTDMSIKELVSEKESLKNQDIEIVPIITEIHKRISLSFAPLVFIIISIPLGAISKHREKSVGFGTALGVIILYYILLAAGETMAIRHIVNPAISMWGPNVLFGGLGVWMARKII